MPSTWKLAASGPLVLQFVTEIVKVVAPPLRRKKVLVREVPWSTWPKWVPFSRLGDSPSATAARLVPSTDSAGMPSRMNARIWPLWRPEPTMMFCALMPVAFVSTQPEPGSIKSLRLVMTPSRQRNAWLVRERVEEVPTIHDWLLMALAQESFVGLSRAPRSCIRRLTPTELVSGTFHSPLEEVTSIACSGTQLLVTVLFPTTCPMSLMAVAVLMGKEEDSEPSTCISPRSKASFVLASDQT